MLNLQFLVDRIENMGVAVEKGLLVLTYDTTKLAQWYALSGGWGKGPLPYGEYLAGNLQRLPDTAENAPFKKEGFPWTMNLFPQFQTDRTALCIHADGNVPGTLGCIGITENDLSCFYTMSAILPLLFKKQIHLTVKKFTLV